MALIHHIALCCSQNFMSIFSPALSIADNTGKWHGSFLALITFLCHLLATAWVVIPVSDSLALNSGSQITQEHLCPLLQKDLSQSGVVSR